MKNLKRLTTILFLGSAFTAFPWGQKGHDVTAYIAEKHLTPNTKKAVEEILDGKSIVYYANWLDNASHTPAYAYTKTWHYKNIDQGVDYGRAPINKAGDVVSGIEEQVVLLRDSTTSIDDKQLALKIVVHLLGDIHQPMHLGHASDLGGNKVPIQYFGKQTNLHSLWDSPIPEAAHKWTYTEWQEQIDRLSNCQVKEILSKRNPDQWAEETYEICTQVYAATKPDTNISYDYISNWTPVVEEQFVRGGIRLADLLNSIFDQEYNAATKQCGTKHNCTKH